MSNLYCSLLDCSPELKGVTTVDEFFPLHSSLLLQLALVMNP